jgi:RNA polymerase sigma-70 factor (ECF subfamily)
MPHRRELFAAALRFTKEPASAEDLVQETLMRALSAWDSYQAGSNCRAWLYRILTNSFINIHRQRKRHRRFTHERGDDGVIALYGVERRRHRGPDDTVIHQALSDEVTAALDSLSDDYRKVVELADLEGIRYKDIAEKLDIPIGTVMSRLFRARRQLEAALGEYAAEAYGISRAA